MNQQMKHLIQFILPFPVDQRRFTENILVYNLLLWLFFIAWITFTYAYYQINY